MHPEAPKFDFARTTAGYQKDLSDWWQQMANWIIAALQKKNWPVAEFSTAPTCSKTDIEQYENDWQIRLPQDLADTLTTFSASATMNIPWPPKGSEEEIALREFQSQPRGIMFGGGPLSLWSFEWIRDNTEEFQEFCEPYLETDEDDDEEDQEFSKHFVDTIPLGSIDNGDWTALNHRNGTVLYLAHDGDEEIKGTKLGTSFTDFITRWLWAGTPWMDFVRDQMSFDLETGEIAYEGKGISDWHDWLRAH